MQNKPRLTRSALLIIALLLTHVAQAADAQPGLAPGERSDLKKPETTLFVGGVGGVYFFAQPGELVIEVEKRDLNRRDGTTELRALLAGPDRRVLAEASIPDDEKPRRSELGPVQRCKLTTRVESAGVYALNITVSRDRYGTEMVWGFRSNCEKYIIETSRGHKDEAHEEPIVLASGDRAANICFLPRQGAFAVELLGLPTNSPPVTMYNQRGELITTLNADSKGQAHHQFAADVHREATPWRLHFPMAQATVRIDGLTRWNSTDVYPNLACWTPDAGSWFPFLDHRWLVTPYNRTVYGRTDQEQQIEFRVYNNSARQKTIQLATEFPEDKWSLRLSAERVVLGPKQATNVLAIFKTPSEKRVARIRARPLDDPHFTTYSTLTAHPGAAPSTRTLTMPIVLKPYQHENEQFGYVPDYPTESQPYFDLRNQPFFATIDGLKTWRNGTWVTSPFASAVKTRPRSLDASTLSLVSSKVAFDRDNDVYLLTAAGRTVALLHSTDGGQSFAAYDLPGSKSGEFDIEQFSGNNVSDQPPALLRYTQTARDPNLIWRRMNNLELFVPKKAGDLIIFGEPVLLSDKCIGLAGHSGIPASVISKGSKIHVTWGEATDVETKVPGVPTFVATYDRETQTLSKPALVAYGAPANDSHNSPSITMDKQGYLHLLGGTHGRPFPSSQSLKPNDSEAGWTEATPTNADLNQTYIGLVCGPDGTLHCVFRLWRFGKEPFPASTYGTLAYQRKRPGQPWEIPQILVVAPFSEYSIFYHRLTIDRKGRLFVSYDYWSTFWFYRNDHRGSRRALLMSPDGGESWKLAETKDLIVD